MAFPSNDDFPVPLDVYDEFEQAFLTSTAIEPASLPIPNPSKAFWTHPGLSSDFPKDSNDTEGWKCTNPHGKEGSEGPLVKEADIVIIGSGITGVSAAYHLSRISRKSGKKLNVVILEARDFCSGATARNGGHLTATISQHFSVLATLYPPAEVKRCFDLESHTVSSILSLIKENKWEQDVDLIKGGHNVLMFTEAEMERAKSDWEAARKAGVVPDGQGIEWSDAKQTKEKYGASYPSFRTSGHNLWPLKLVNKMYELAKDRSSSRPYTQVLTMNEKTPLLPGKEGNDTTLDDDDLHDPSSSCLSCVQPFIDQILPNTKFDSYLTTDGERDPFNLTLHTHTPALSISSSSTTSNSNNYTIETPRGSITTPLIIHATNAYASYLLPHMAGPQGIVPVRGQVVAVRADVGYLDEGEKEGKGIDRSGWSGNEGFEYWFPRPNPVTSFNNPEDPKKAHAPLIILGGARETLRNRGYGMYTTDDSILDPEASLGLRKFLPKVFPGKFGNSKDNGVEVEWSGIMGFTKSGDPFVGRLLDEGKRVVKGQYIAAGFTGHGMPRAYGCAEALVDLIWADLEETGEQWKPPSWLPHHYLTEDSMHKQVHAQSQIPFGVSEG